MRDRIDFDALPYAAGALLFGIVTLVVRDFALTWQPVPQGVPAREALAIASGLILVAGAIAAPWRSLGPVRLILPFFYAVWVLALHVPNVIKTPSVATLLGVAEILSLTAAGVALLPERLSPAWLRPTARILYGVCPIVWGVSHWVYADFTASMIPAWIPAHLFLAYFTGAAHFAAGLAILSGVLAPLAARLLALMTLSLVLLIHVPGVAAALADRMQWTMLAAALSVTGGAWLAQRLLPGRSGKQGSRAILAASPA